MKKIFTLSILFAIAMVFSETVEARQYVKTVKKTTSYNKKEYKANHIFEDEVDSAKSCFIHIIKAKPRFATGGVGDSTMFLITRWDNNLSQVRFNDNDGKERYDIHQKAEILVNVGDDYLPKEAIKFIDKSERDSICQNQFPICHSDTTNTTNTADIVVDPSSSKTDLCSLIIGIVVGIIIAIIIVVIIIFIPTKRKKEEHSGVAEDGAKNREPQVTERKLTWKEKIGCRLAPEYLEEISEQFKKKEQELLLQNEELEKNVQDLTNQVSSAQGKLRQQEQDYKKLKDTTLPDAKKEALKEGRETENKEILEKIKEAFKENLKDSKNIMNIDDACRILAEAIKKIKNELNDAKTKVTNESQNAQKEINRQKAKIKDDLNSRKKELEEDYKKQQSEAEAKMQLAEKMLSEAQHKSEDADNRIAEIEATEKGELVVKLEQAEAKLNENQAHFDQRDSQIKQLQAEKAKDKGHIQSLEKDLEKEKKSHTATKQEWRDKVESMKASHKSELKTREEEHADNVKNLKEGHQTEINNIKASHNEELHKKDDIHRSEIEKEHAKAKAKEDELNDVIETQKDAIRGLENRIQIEANMLRNEAELTSHRLFEFLKENEIMAACDDSYKYNVEEKIQDIVYEAKQMCQTIKNMPLAKTPSEWIKTMTEYFENQINRNTSLINRMLKFYAMSNVPFMLDSGRDNGIYFVRKNMTQAYDYIASLLAQCGIIPIIPSAFVENKDEGLYEVEGQFNDIESFCPGNMTQHVEFIERGNDGLSGIIVGITRVGYIIKNEKVIKAQVITQ